MDNFYALMARMKNISRWALMRSVMPENVQEHSHMVAVLAHALGVIRRDVFGVPCDPADYAAVALFHAKALVWVKQTKNASTWNAGSCCSVV